MSKNATLFKDLGKNQKDLIEKGFPVDKVEFESESTTDNGTKLKVTATRNAKGVLSAGLEGPSYTWKDFGLTCKFIGKTDDNGTFSLEASVADKGVEGLKATVTVEQKGTSTAAKGEQKAISAAQTIKAQAEYRHKHAALNSVLTYPLTTSKTGPTLQASGVAKYEQFSVGGDASVDLTKSAVTKQNYKLAYEHSSKFNAVAYCNLDKNQFYGLSLFSRVRDNVDLGLDVAQKYYAPVELKEGEVADATKPAPKNGPDFVFAAQYQMDKSTTLKAKFQYNDARLAVALKQKLSDAVTATLAADLDAAKLQSGSHKFGLNLTINP